MVLWSLGMLFGAYIFVLFAAASLSSFGHAIDETSPASTFIGVVWAGLAFLVARWWWGEARRWREILPER